MHVPVECNVMCVMSDVDRPGPWKPNNSRNNRIERYMEMYCFHLCEMFIYYY